jgi:hypothetical protein
MGSSSQESSGSAQERSYYDMQIDAARACDRLCLRMSPTTLCATEWVMAVIVVVLCFIVFKYIRRGCASRGLLLNMTKHTRVVEEQASSNQSETASTIDNCRLGAMIGSGSFGIVKSAHHIASEREFAIKIVPSTKRNADQFLQEITNHRRMEHPHVVRLHEVLEKDGDMYMVMELAVGGDLHALMENTFPHLHEDEARRLFSQVVTGVSHQRHSPKEPRGGESL